MASHPYLTEDARWQAVLGRDTGAAGHFVYAVRSTGTYASPGARARLPRRENVEFFDSATAAEAAGYRPSLHSGGNVQALAERVAQACRHLASADIAPRLHELAAEAGMSPFAFHRLFKAETGLTPKAYAVAQRAARLRQALEEKGSITDAIYQAGFTASSQFYEKADHLLGMRASDRKRGGAGMSIRFAIGQCSLGAILVAESQRGICAILLGEDAAALLEDLQDTFPRAELQGGDPDFEQRVATVVGFVEAPGTGLSLPLDIRGTAFQQRVWQALQAIPAGSTASYAEIAARIGSPAATRAVARACASNLIAIAIPCHRVIRQDGGMAGYRWGLERKRELLEREAASCTQVTSGN